MNEQLTIIAIVFTAGVVMTPREAWGCQSKLEQLAMAILAIVILALGWLGLVVLLELAR